MVIMKKHDDRKIEPIIAIRATTAPQNQLKRKEERDVLTQLYINHYYRIIWPSLLARRHHLMKSN